METANRVVQEVEACFEDLALHKALMAVWEFINVTNKYIVEREPWTLAKDPANKARLATIIYNLLESLRIIAVFITPFMPQSAKKIMDQIGIADMTGQNFDSLRQLGRPAARQCPQARRIPVPPGGIQKGRKNGSRKNRKCPREAGNQL